MIPGPSVGSDEHLLACSASAWQGEPLRCRWCNDPLSGRRVRWCSNECANANGRNHWWTSASPAARKRDGACVVCGHAGVDHGVGPRGLEVHHLVPLHKLTLVVRVWARDRQEEVIEERLVRHSDSGCWHHLDGLVTLCKPHHLAAHAALRSPDDQLAIEV